MHIEKIAVIHTDFPEKFGIPRQSGLVAGLRGIIVFEPEFRNRDALRGLEDFSHLWLIWGFSANRRRRQNSKESGIDVWQPTVRPPRLGGNKSMGVFATRSPFRPNPIGLSCVEIEHIEYDTSRGPVIHVLGADLMDGTPIYDIKPYIKYADCHPDASCGYADRAVTSDLEVVLPSEIRAKFHDKTKLTALIDVLRLDPRPSYQKDSSRVYGLAFAGQNIRFNVCGGVLTVTDID